MAASKTIKYNNSKHELVFSFFSFFFGRMNWYFQIETPAQDSALLSLWTWLVLIQKFLSWTAFGFSNPPHHFSLSNLLSLSLSLLIDTLVSISRFSIINPERWFFFFFFGWFVWWILFGGFSESWKLCWFWDCGFWKLLSGFLRVFLLNCLNKLLSGYLCRRFSSRSALSVVVSIQALFAVFDNVFRRFQVILTGGTSNLQCSSLCRVRLLWPVGIKNFYSNFRRKINFF